jgi:hypothetical protein
MLSFGASDTPDTADAEKVIASVGQGLIGASKAF